MHTRDCTLFRRLRLRPWTSALLLALASNSLHASGQAVPASNVSNDSAKDTARDSSTQTASGAAVGQPTAPQAATAVHLSVLPAPLPASVTQGINVDTRSKAILTHLNEVIRYYRMMVAPIQKTGEPSDMLYAEQAQAEATRAAQLAFQASRDEAALLARIQNKARAAVTQAPQTETQKLAVVQLGVRQQMQDLQSQLTATDAKMSAPTRHPDPQLPLEKQALEGRLKLAQATFDALTKVAGVSTAQTNSGLQGDINRLQHAAPELVDKTVKPVVGTIEPLGSLRDAGVATQAEVLFQLLGADRAIEQRIRESQVLHDQAVDMRTPLLKILHATVEAGQTLQSTTTALPAVKSKGAVASDAAALASTKKAYDELTEAFTTISDVSVPISQEVLLLEQAQGNLVSWRSAVEAERATILHSLLARVFSIALILSLLYGVGSLWQRATIRYVQDLRRRRQLLLVRRLVVGFLSGIVLIGGFVTQFNSLATFAGFITAGIAVGLQTMLLSVAAYFFIVGRYGVSVGDRITVAGVTGDVVEVGLVRFYMMELIGSGTELHPTGRVAVFANSVLFQSGTPLYKQLPGTDYVWHEITLKLKPDSDYEPATKLIYGAVASVYGEYKARIDEQHRQVEKWMDTAMESPGMAARLQLSDGLQYAILYPVEIAAASETDERIVTKIMAAISSNAVAMQAVDGLPTLRAVVKG
ncbi:mechanosensitive ion channel family protein [Acidipila sp. EB88]|uniref:mechanosensitive ion channel family protein n=1 Tax=Acidipila sp. EB88 TaxID=2305226 RepID=UPI000F5F469F|nr:mechanosensitive ion channel family protein [Acidipila sp. EB88]RRA49835.1 mechanosensitive ion channel family protein [Acidipila sp. EB88]